MVEINAKNLLFTQCYDIKNIFSSYFKNSFVQFFEYATFTEDGNVKLLSTHPELTNLIFMNGLNFTKDQLFRLNKFSLLNTCYIPDNFERHKYTILMNASKNNFNIDHFFAIYIKTEEHHELYSFGSNANDGMAMNKYLNNINYFESFVLYFNNQIKNIKQLSMEESKISIPNFNKDKLIGADKNYLQKAMPLKTDRFIVKLDNANDGISMREKQCLSLTVQGHSAKEIAKILEISHRTVEGYIENIKLKFGITKKSALWKIMSSNYISEL